MVKQTLKEMAEILRTVIGGRLIISGARLAAENPESMRRAAPRSPCMANPCMGDRDGWI